MAETETQQPTTATIPPVRAEEPFVEQHYPREMSWYAAEGPEGMLEDVGLWIRENPWAAVGIATAAGLALTFAAGPLGRLAAQGLEALCNKEQPATPPDIPQTP